MIGNFYYDTPSSCGEFDCICKLNSPTSFPPDFAFSRGSGEFLFLPTKIQNIYYFDNQLVIDLRSITRLPLVISFPNSRRNLFELIVINNNPEVLIKRNIRIIFYKDCQYLISFQLGKESSTHLNNINKNRF